MAASCSTGGGGGPYSGSFATDSCAKGGCSPVRRTFTGTGPTFSSSTNSTSLPDCDRYSSASRQAVPTVGCPAKGISFAGVKMRSFANASARVACCTNTVSDRLNSRAIVCICSVPSASASSTTASGLPV
jgi:hypothetical protein